MRTSPKSCAWSQDADIVVVEFAMNDGTQVDCSKDGSGTVPARASFERLLRKLQVPHGPGEGLPLTAVVQAWLAVG